MVRNLDELYIELKDMEIPGAYFKFKKEDAPGLPFYVYFSDGNTSFYADDENYSESVRVFVELYTAERDDVLEKKMESILKRNGLTYEKEIDFVDDENCYMITYTLYFMEA